MAHVVLMPNLRSAAPNSTIEQANCTAYSRFGQFGEVAKLLLVLLHTSGGAPGSFVEIGAHDGITISNTLLLESCWGWAGLLVEADPDNWHALSRSGRASHLEHAAVCAAGMGVVNMSINRGYGVFSGMDGKTREHATKLLRARRIPPPERVEVPCARLDTLMARAKLPTRVNFLSLDVEGAELEVVSTVDVGRFDLVLVELDGHDRGKDKSVNEKLSQAGLAYTGLRIWTSLLFAHHTLLAKLSQKGENVLALAEQIDWNLVRRTKG